MRVVSVAMAATLWAASAAADPVVFQPEGCDFQLTFPAAPIPAQQKSATSRGDTVVTNKAELHLDADGRPNIFRAECTRVAHMGSMDESILADNLRDLAGAYKIQNAAVSVRRNRVAGSVGLIHGRLALGGKDFTIELRRYTGPNNIFDVWIGAEPDAFPTEADNEFLKSIKLNGTEVP